MTDANNTSVIFIAFCSHKDFLFPLTVSTLYAVFFSSYLRVFSTNFTFWFQDQEIHLMIISKSDCYFSWFMGVDIAWGIRWGFR